MVSRAAFIKQWREHDLGLSLRFVADRAGLTEAELKEIEEGKREPFIDELSSLARVLGLHLDHLLPAEVRGKGVEPIRLLLKSSETFRPPEQSKAIMADSARAALDLLELCNARSRHNGAAKVAPAPLPKNTSVPEFKSGADLARALRKAFGVRGPIESMHDFVSQTLGIPVLGARLGEYGPDAFTVYSPGRRAAIVLNITPGTKNTHALARRFTLAHELGHALFDRPTNGSALGIACRVSSDRNLGAEARANAFAMRFILPEREVQKLGDAVLKPATFRKLMTEWGVNFAALKLYLTKLRDWTDNHANEVVPDVDVSSPARWVESEALPCEQTPELPVSLELHRREPLMREAFLAFDRGDLGLGELRELLGVDSAVTPSHVAAALGLTISES